ncbi:MAG: reverse transcriptase/maturase family protein [Candidatus Aenigmatarchaeota archaeon]
MLKLQAELESETYKPRPLKRFIIRDPKSRVIHASHFRDRVVHHALCNIIQPIFEKTFIHDSFANQIGKGTHKALNRFDEFKRRVSRNGRLLENAMYSNQTVGHVLKADIKHYFQEVDHEVLMNIIGKKICDERVIWLIDIILNANLTSSDDEICLVKWNKSKGIRTSSSKKGMPLGNLTSQFFANVYLSELDYFVKHQLKARYYIRYVDDFVILHRSRGVLESYQNQIAEFLRSRLRIELHPDKTKISLIYHGTPFLGFRVYYYHKLLKKSNIRHFQRQLEWLIQLYRFGDISEQSLTASVDGWLEYAIYGNTRKMRQRVTNIINKLYPSV